MYVTIVPATCQHKRSKSLHLNNRMTIFWVQKLSPSEAGSSQPSYREHERAIDCEKVASGQGDGVRVDLHQEALHLQEAPSPLLPPGPAILRARGDCGPRACGV